MGICSGSSGHRVNVSAAVRLPKDLATDLFIRRGVDIPER